MSEPQQVHICFNSYGCMVYLTVVYTVAPEEGPSPYSPGDPGGIDYVGVIRYGVDIMPGLSEVEMARVVKEADAILKTRERDE